MSIIYMLYIFSYTDQKPHAYNHSMKIASVSGTICMYEEYMKRKAEQVRRLRLYLQKITILENQQALAQQSIKQTTPSVNGSPKEDNSDSKTQERLQTKEEAKQDAESDKFETTESHEDCEASIPTPISAYESRGSDLTKAETSTSYSRGMKRSLNNVQFQDDSTCLKVKR